MKTTILESCCKIIMIIIMIIICFYLIVLHCEAFSYQWDSSSKGVKEYTSLYGAYGIHQLLATFLVALTAQIYLEQLKITKKGIENAVNAEIRLNWNQKVDNWLMSTANLSDVMRQILVLSKQDIYMILSENNFSISNEAILLRILNLFSNTNLKLLEVHNKDYIRNKEKYFFKNQWYTLDSFYLFINIISDSHPYNGSYERCLKFYNENLPKDLYKIPGQDNFEMLRT